MQTALIQPWLTFIDCFKALAFYKNAFGAEETYHFEPAEGELISRLSIGGSEFWIASGADKNLASGHSVRFVVVVPNPEFFFQRAVEAGATKVFEVQEEHGWRTAKVTDPFGYSWEFGHEVK